MKATRLRAQRSDSIRGEAPWIPTDMVELEAVRRALTDAGHSAPVVNGVTGWLVSKALGEEDLSTSVTRSKYRKLLADSGPSPLGEDPVRVSAATRDLQAAHNHGAGRSVSLAGAVLLAA